MAKLSRLEREEIGRKRILRVLGVLTVANQRTLEQKIADAGPFGQRIDPHILADVRHELLQEQVVGQVHSVNAPWFFIGNTHPEIRTARLNELTAIYRPYLQLADRNGQALEIAVYRALSIMPAADFAGRFKDLDDHDDSSRYRKEEPPQHIGVRFIPGDERLDFILRTPEAGALGIECKNVRHWIYPHSAEIKDLLRKCLALDAVPVLIARRIHYSTFTLFSKCGVIVHQTYNQLFPASEAALAEKVRDKMLLGYHDIRLGNQPDGRLLKFITKNVASVAPVARERFAAHVDLLTAYALRDMPYYEFAGRVLRRSRGENEDGLPIEPDDYSSEEC